MHSSAAAFARPFVLFCVFFSVLFCYLLHVSDIKPCSTLLLKGSLQRGQLIPKNVRREPESGEVQVASSPSIYKMLWHISIFPSHIFPRMRHYKERLAFWDYNPFKKVVIDDNANKDPILFWVGEVHWVLHFQFSFWEAWLMRNGSLKSVQ